MAANAPTPNGGSDPPTGPSDRLYSWKEIANHFRKDVSTVQRWKKKYPKMPVYKQDDVGAIYASKSDLDTWWNTRPLDVEADANTSTPEVEDSSPQQYDQPPQATMAGSRALDPVILDDTVEDEYLSDDLGRQRFFTRRRIFLALLLLLVAGLAVIWRESNSGTAIAAPARLVVLPFDNLSNDAAQDYFARGLTYDVTSEVGKLQSPFAKVVARSTADLYKGKPLSNIGRDLHVDYVVEGNVRREGERVRINVELIQVSDESQTWADGYDEQMPTVSSRAAEIASTIEHQIALHSQSAQRSSIFNWHPFSPPARPAKIGAANAKAYDDFLRGRYLWNKRGVDSMAKGMHYFQAAIAEDPNYAAAYAGVADGLALLGSAQSGMLPPTKAFPQAKAAAEKALSLDDRLPEAHASMAYISLVYDRDLAKAQREFQRAIELDPSYPTAHQWFGLYYEALGDTKGAIRSVARAKEQDPLSLAVNVALAEAYYFDRDYDRALQQAGAAIELDNNSAIAHFNRGRAYLQKNQFDFALDDFQQARASSPNAATLVYLAYTYARKGDTAKARSYLRELDEAGKSQYVPAIYYAVIYTGLEDKNQAFRWFEKAIDERCDYLVFLRHDPMADALAGDPRFTQLIQKIGLPAK